MILHEKTAFGALKIIIHMGNAGFYTLTEAKVLVERWRQLYNRVRPHSALGYRPPAPEAIEPMPPGIPTLSDIGEKRLTQKVVQL